MGDLGSSSNRSNSSNDSGMAWPGVVAPNSSGNRGGAGLATVAVVEKSLDGRVEGAVVDRPGGGAVVQSLSTPPARWLRIPTIVPVSPSTAPRPCASNSPRRSSREIFTAAIKLVVVIRNVRRTSLSGLTVVVLAAPT